MFKGKIVRNILCMFKKKKKNLIYLKLQFSTAVLEGLPTHKFILDFT